MKTTITGLVLAGGKSRRMGRDKALLPWNSGMTLLDHAVHRLGQVCGEVYVLSDHPRHDHPGALRIADATPDRGPLSGIVAGMQAQASDWYFVLACDMPWVGVEALDKLAAEVAPNPTGLQVVLYQDQNGIQPLCALYHCSALPHMRSALESGQLRMQDLISELNIKILIPAMDQPDMLSNWNQPEDAAAVRVKVLLFASLRDRLGFSEREMSATDTDSLRAWLESQLPEAAQLPYRIAVNEDLVADNQKLQNGDVVALMPPFAGG